MSDPSELLVDIEDGIALLRLNRPERLNAVTPGFHDLLYGTAKRLRADPAVRAIVLTGEGRAFCAGADVGALGSGGYGEADSEGFPLDEEAGWPVGWFGMIVPKPVVCALNGAAVGYGAELAGTCDLRIAGESGRLGWVFSKLGIVTDMGVGPVVLPRLVGPSRAARMMYSGEIVGAQEALRIGLVDEVVPDDQLRERAMAVARELAAGAPNSIAVHKRQLLASMLPSAHEVYFENLKAFQEALASPYSKEGMAAFMEKRAPDWGGVG